jgi:hypothetical protein
MNIQAKSILGVTQRKPAVAEVDWPQTRNLGSLAARYPYGHAAPTSFWALPVRGDKAETEVRVFRIG